MNNMRDLHDAVVEVAPEIRPMLELKWPNDLLLSGAKFAGILIEGEGREEEGAVAIGIGVNCTAHPAGGRCWWSPCQCIR